MNKISQYLVPASLAALVCALLGGLWLVWQTIEESRALERHNRELQASLEASRIRVANFCEYPTDALCRVDERSGLVVGVMPSELIDIPTAEKFSAPAPVNHAEQAPSGAPALAIENIEKTAKAQSNISAQAVPVQIPAAPPAVELKPAPAEEKKAVIAEEKKLPPVVEAVSLPVSEPASAPVSTPEPPAKPAQENSLAEPAPVVPAPEENAPILGHEITGKFAVEAPAQAVEEKKIAPEVAKKKSADVKPAASKAAEQAKKSWSRIELDGDIFAFTLTGAGPSISAHGQLRSSPWRYELTLDGLWEVRQHHGISHRLVSRMSTKVVKGKTVITFHLKNKPYKSSLHRLDARTVSVRIR